MKKIILTIIVISVSAVCTANCHAYDYSGQEYVGMLPWSEYAPTYEETADNDEYCEFCLQYEKNRQTGDHLANLRLVDKYLPVFYGSEHEASLYDARTETIYLLRQKEKSPMTVAGYRFDIRDGAGYVIAGLTNLDYRNISALRVGFKVLDKNGVATGKMKDFYYSVGADVCPGETDVFIWQVDDMTEPASLGDFRVFELVFADRSKWYAHMENR